MYSHLVSLTYGSTNRAPFSIKVKVFQRVQGHDSFMMPTLDFILVDEKGTKIQASVNSQAYYCFQGLHEGAWAEISGVVVSNANWRDWNHFPSTHMYLLVLPTDATVTPIQSLSDHHFFKFTPCEDVISRFFNIAHPIDLIGTIHTVGKLAPAKNSANAERSIPFTMRDARDVELYCIAYGRVVEQFSFQWSRPHGPVVRCLLNEWRVSQSRRLNSMMLDNIIVDGGEHCRFWFTPEIPGVDVDAMVRRHEADMTISEVADSWANSTM